MSIVSKPFSSKLLGLTFCFILFLSSAPLFAFGGENAELTVSGPVLLNGVNVSNTIPLVKSSRIVTGANSAVANLGGYGQLFIASNTELVLKPTADGVKVDLVNGAVRVKGGSRGAATVQTSAQSRVQVAKGALRLADSQETINAGASRDFATRLPFASSSAPNSDYTVSAGTAVSGSKGQAVFTDPGTEAAAKPVSRVNP